MKWSGYKINTYQPENLTRIRKKKTSIRANNSNLDLVNRVDFF